MNDTHGILTRDYASLPLGRLHYGRGGMGPSLLMIHSTPRSHRQFHLLYEELATRFDVIAPDTPGFGQSDPLPADCDFEALADNLAALLDALQQDRVHVYGFHTGNKIAAAFAARHPDRVDGLILAGQTHSLIPDQSRRDAAIRDIVAKYFVGANAGSAGTERQWLADLSVITGMWTDPRAMARLGDDPGALAARERYVADYVMARHSLVPIYHANYAFDFEAAVKAIAARTLVMEFATPQEDVLGRQAAVLSGIIREATARTYENVGGDAHDLRPGEIADDIAGFFGQ